MKTKKQKGITLIAVIITVIVMLILAGVSVSVVLNTGLFKTVQGVAKNTQLVTEEEAAMANGTIKVGNTEISIDEYTDRILSGIPVELKIGDIIEYTPASNYTVESPFVVSNEDTANLKLAGCKGSFYTDMGADVEWKVIGVEGNIIKIIPKAVSTSELTLSSANGWNNGIKALNDVCGAIYGNTTSDKYTATAESLTVKEINEIIGYTPIASSESYDASNYEEGTNYFPIEYLKEKGVENPEEETEGCGYSANSSITIVPTWYYYWPESQAGFDQTKFKNWVVLDSNYWLASKCLYSPDQRNFMMHFVQHETRRMRGQVLFFTDGTGYNPSNALRPVVSLDPKVSLHLEQSVGEGDSIINYWVFE